MRQLISGDDVGYPLFYAVFENIPVATNKFMATLFNSVADTTNGIVEVARIYRYNWDTTYPVSNTILNQTLLFISSRTIGTVIPTLRVDSVGGPTDSFPFVIADTGTTGVVVSSIIRKVISYQSNPTPEHNAENVAIIYERNLGDSGLILRNSSGISIINNTFPGSNPGTCSYVFEWHVDVDKTSF